MHLPADQADHAHLLGVSQIFATAFLTTIEFQHHPTCVETADTATLLDPEAKINVVLVYSQHKSLPHVFFGEHKQ